VPRVGEEREGARDQAARNLGDEERACECGGDGDLGLAGRPGVVVATVMMMAAVFVPTGMVMAPVMVVAAMVVIVTLAVWVIVFHRSNLDGF